MRLINQIPEHEEITVHKLTCLSGLDHRTVNKYIKLIIYIQKEKPVVRLAKGARLFFGKSAHRNAPQPQASPDLIFQENPEERGV